MEYVTDERHRDGELALRSSIVALPTVLDDLEARHHLQVEVDLGDHVKVTYGVNPHPERVGSVIAYVRVVHIEVDHLILPLARREVLAEE